MEREAAGPLTPRACQKYDLGLCFDQEDCKDAHPMNGRAPFGTIKCAIGLPTFKRATRMKPGWICKKGSGCLYDHEGYSKERVAEAKARWQHRRRATRRDRANRNSVPLRSYVCVDSSGLFKGFYKFRSGPQKSCEVLDVVLVVSSWDPPPWGTEIITLPPDTAVPNMPKTPENGVCESL